MVEELQLREILLSACPALPFRINSALFTQLLDPQRLIRARPSSSLRRFVFFVSPITVLIDTLSASLYSLIIRPATTTIMPNAPSSTFPVPPVDVAPAALLVPLLPDVDATVPVVWLPDAELAVARVLDPP